MGLSTPCHKSVQIQDYSCQEGSYLAEPRGVKSESQTRISSLRRKKPKRRVQVKAREDRIVQTRKNDVWSMDFVSDALFTGEKIRILKWTP